MVFARLGVTHDSGLMAVGESLCPSKTTEWGSASKSALQATYGQPGLLWGIF